MSQTTAHPKARETGLAEPLDHHIAEGLPPGGPGDPPTANGDGDREWLLVGLALVALIAVIGIGLAIVSIATGGRESTTIVREAPAQTAAAPDAPAPTLADAKGVAFEKFGKRRPDPAGHPGRRGQDVRRRRLPARHAGLQGPGAHRGLELLGQRPGAPRHRRLGADGGHRGRRRRLHADQRLGPVDEGRPAALAGLPLGRGQPRHALRRSGAGQVDALPLRRRAPGRLHVPLRHAAGPDAHRRRHGRHVRGQAQGACRPWTRSSG